MTATAQRWTRPVPAWTPPLDSGALHDLLERVRNWQPFDGGALLDDIAAALDDVPPAEGNTAPLAQRLRGHLARLVTIAVASEADQDTTAAQLALQARTLQTEPLPGERRAATAHLRRLGWIANELHDRLTALRCLKEAA
ncbi:DUF6415 family natural product biosynthesis protein [Streptomyces albogriseolus]|uniref:DUF6415 family natural product biosynthesis protein n=1 Tax=Streptomyces albogriseolus TaxID=1887 RepID=UPI00225577D5|nr:DUF6415 family natural product biosynthesis protein [Streptomyces viridodiastaticus]MCX4571414.1 DUF6415 family natural product biosynthesis protein [Streptomyces viridodiastaticus]